MGGKFCARYTSGWGNECLSLRGENNEYNFQVQRSAGDKRSFLFNTSSCRFSCVLGLSLLKSTSFHSMQVSSSSSGNIALRGERLRGSWNWWNVTRLSNPFPLASFEVCKKMHRYLRQHGRVCSH